MTVLHRWTEAAAKATRNERIADLSLVARQVFNELKRDKQCKWLTSYVRDRFKTQGVYIEGRIDRSTCFMVLSEVAPDAHPSRITRAVAMLEELYGNNSGVSDQHLGATVAAWVAIKCGSTLEFIMTFEHILIDMLGGANDRLPRNSFTPHQAVGYPESNSVTRWVEEQLDDAVGSAMPSDSGWCPTPTAGLLAATPTVGSAIPSKNPSLHHLNDVTVSPERPTSSHDAVVIDDIPSPPHKPLNDASCSSFSFSVRGEVSIVPAEPEADETLVALLELLVDCRAPRSIRLVEAAILECPTQIPERRKNQHLILCRIATTLDTGESSTTPTRESMMDAVEVSTKARRFFDYRSSSGSKRKQTRTPSTAGLLNSGRLGASNALDSSRKESSRSVVSEAETVVASSPVRPVPRPTAGPSNDRSHSVESVDTTSTAPELRGPAAYLVTAPSHPEDRDSDYSDAEGDGSTAGTGRSRKPPDTTRGGPSETTHGASGKTPKGTVDVDDDKSSNKQRAAKSSDDGGCCNVM